MVHAKIVLIVSATKKEYKWPISFQICPREGDLISSEGEEAWAKVKRIAHIYTISKHGDREPCKIQLFCELYTFRHSTLE